MKIALIGRREPEKFSEKQKRVLKNIEEMGSTVLYLHGDVTDKEQCTHFVETIRNKLGSINGVFIGIKNISHQLMQEVSPHFFKNNILSKLKGVWLLDHLTSIDQPDFMATFSSISSLTGGPTGGDCCASNLFFLDSFTDYRLAQGKTTITMNYTLIESDDGSLLSDRLSMIPPITKEEFVECLNVFMEKNLPFAMVADFDRQVMNMVLPFMKIRFSKEILDELKQKGEIQRAADISKKATGNSERNVSR